MSKPRSERRTTTICSLFPQAGLMLPLAVETRNQPTGTKAAERKYPVGIAPRRRWAPVEHHPDCLRWHGESGLRNATASAPPSARTLAVAADAALDRHDPESANLDGRFEFDGEGEVGKIDPRLIPLVEGGSGGDVPPRRRDGNATGKRPGMGPTFVLFEGAGGKVPRPQLPRRRERRTAGEDVPATHDGEDA